MQMSIKNYESIIEALLFTAGDRLTLEKITDILDLDRKTTRKIMNNMIHNFNNSKRGLMIREIDNGYQMCTKPDHFEYVKKLTTTRHRHNLSQAAYETLSIIAYKQPITRARVEEIRGVNSDSSIINLLDKGIIKEAGKLDTPGRPRLYRTSQSFLRLFGFRAISDLPKLEMNEMLGVEDASIMEISGRNDDREIENIDKINVMEQKSEEEIER